MPSLPQPSRWRDGRLVGETRGSPVGERLLHLWVHCSSIFPAPHVLFCTHLSCQRHLQFSTSFSDAENKHNGGGRGSAEILESLFGLERSHGLQFSLKLILWSLPSFLHFLLLCALGSELCFTGKSWVSVQCLYKCVNLHYLSLIPLTSSTLPRFGHWNPRLCIFPSRFRCKTIGKKKISWYLWYDNIFWIMLFSSPDRQFSRLAFIISGGWRDMIW